MRDEAILVLAPHGRDARVAIDLLARNGMDAIGCATLDELCDQLRCGAGASLVTEEALACEDLSRLVSWLDAQPPWADLPFIVLANGHKGTRSSRAFETLESLRNVILLERPLHAETMVRAIRSALSARRRQYEARDTLARSREELERLVVERTQERETALAQLHEAQKLETIGQLTGGVAHDFNNLLTPLMGNLDMIRRRIPADDSHVQRLIDNALQATARAATLVQRLLAFARRQELQPVPVDVANLLGGLEDLVARSIGPTILVSMKAEENLPPARVDPGQLELAILNLAINGRDAMPDGGSLTIEADIQVVDQGQIDGLGSGRYVRISVTDTGVGMDEWTLKRSVEPFFSTKGLGKGTGLGLSMIHGLAAQSGGALTLSSRPGAGTRASLWLPVADAKAGKQERSLNRPLPLSVPATILLVDDEEIVRSGTADMLLDLGYDVIAAGSGAEGLQVLQNQDAAIDLVISDYLMPGMNGADFIREARTLHPATSALLITGFTDLTEVAGFDVPRLAKPFRQADLAARVAELISASRNQTAALLHAVSAS